MRERITRFLEGDLIRRIGTSPLSNIPGTSAAYEWLHSASVPGNPCWIDWFGYDLYIDPTESPGSLWYHKGEDGYEQEIIRTVEQYVGEGDTVFDIGACYGTHTLAFRRNVGESGQVIAFEPTPKNISFLTKTIDRNGLKNVELVEAAASNATDKVEFYEHSHAGKSGIKKKKSLVYDTMYEVEAVRLSDFIEARDLGRVDFIKLDIEGAESDAIEGLEPALDRVRQIVIELHPSKMSQDDIDRMVDILNDNGELTEVDENWERPGDGNPITSGAGITSKKYLKYSSNT